MATRQRTIFIAALTITCLSLLLVIAQAKDETKSAGAKSPQALWGELGLAINNTPGNTPQQNAKIVAAADGNLAMVWEDGRNGFTNIFAQKIDKSGACLWADVGVQVCGGLQGNGDQNNPSLIDDGAGGIIVVWQGYSNGNADIFAQRISSSGNQLWGTSGVTICNAAAGQFAPEIISDGAGGAIITWYDYRGGAGEDVYAQRVDKDGNVLWQDNGLAVCTATGTQWYPKIASDGAGGAIIVWSDSRTSSSDDNIFGQRLDPNGKALWDKDGISICSAPNNQEKPVIAATDKGAIIAWQDSRSGNVDIYAQKIDLSGKPLWGADGLATATAPYSQEDPQIAIEESGGALIVWTDNREEQTAIFAQKITADGKIEWGDAGRQLAKANGDQRNPKIVKSKTLDWLVVWEDTRQGTSLLYGQKINSSGVNLWLETGLPLAPGGKAEEKPWLALTADGQAVVVWQDRRNGGFDLFGQKLATDGTPGWPADGQPLANAMGSVIHQNVSLIDSGRGEIIMAFEDARSGYLNIYAQKMSLQGGLLWGKNAIPLAKVKADQTNPCLVSDGAGGALVVWEDHRDPNFTKIYGQHISAQGKKTWEGGSHPLTDLDSQQTSPAIISDGDGGAIVVWQDERNPLSLKDLYGQRINAGNDGLWGTNGLPICAENGDQADPAMIGDGSGGAIIAWTDYRRSERNPDIYAQRVTPSGKPLWDKGALLVCGAPDVQKGPSLSKDKEGGVIITWTDKGGGSNDIYAQRVSLEGKPLWLTDGIPVCQSPRTQQNPQISNQVLVWEDYRYGNWDIFANAVSPQGKLLWGDEGVPVVTGPLTQYAPQIITWQDNNEIIAWEDYHSGKQYEIYLQMLNDAGKTQWSENGFQVKSTDGARTPKLLAMPKEKVFLVVWEDYTGGGKALAGQLYSTD
jgi:beta propeller repeat protein